MSTFKVSVVDIKHAAMSNFTYFCFPLPLFWAFQRGMKLFPRSTEMKAGYRCQEKVHFMKQN